MIKIIIFDLWETLGTKNLGVSKELQKHFHIPDTSNFLKRYEKSCQLSVWKNKQDLAKSFLMEFNLPLSRANISFVIKILEKGIRNATLYPFMRQLLATLKKKYSLAILSNTTIFESKIVKKWGVEKHFQAQIYSCHINSLKPSNKSFKEVCRFFQVKPRECIFIDNQRKNVDVAKRLGFQALHYQNISQLKRDLHANGVLT